MKASKILAVLSASALAASMLTMVGASAATEVANSGSVTVTVGEDNVWWTQEAITLADLLGDVDPADVVGIEFSTAGDVDFQIGYNSTELQAGKKEGDEGAYWVTTSKGKEFTLTDIDFNADTYYVSVVVGTGNVGDSADVDWNVLVDNGEEESTSEVDSTESTESTESTPDVEVSLPYTVDTEEGYAGDWAGDGLIPMSVINAVPEGKDMKVTISYKLEDGYDYYLAGPASSTTGWGKLYKEGKQDYITGVDLKSSFSAEDLEKHGQEVGTPVLQNDGYFVIYPAGGTQQELTFNVTADGIAFLKAQAEKYEEEGGLLFQVYGVDITEVTVDVPSEEEDNSVVYEVGEGISYDKPLHFEPTDLEEGVEYTSATINLHGIGTENDPAYWNDWCAYKIIVTDAEGNKTYYAVAGPEVNWDITVEDAEKEEDKIIIPNADVIKTEKGTGKVTVETPFAAGSSIDIVALGWNDTAESSACPYIMCDDIAIGFNKVAPVDSSSSTPDSSSSTPDSSSEVVTPTTSSTASTTSTTSSTKSTTSTAAGKTDTNPSTGAAALGAVGVLLAGAAMVVSKKKD